MNIELPVGPIVHLPKRKHKSAFTSKEFSETENIAAKVNVNLEQSKELTTTDEIKDETQTQISLRRSSPEVGLMMNRRNNSFKGQFTVDTSLPQSNLQISTDLPKSPEPHPAELPPDSEQPPPQPSNSLKTPTKLPKANDLKSLSKTPKKDENHKRSSMSNGIENNCTIC